MGLDGTTKTDRLTAAEGLANARPGKSSREFLRDEGSPQVYTALLLEQWENANVLHPQDP